jgi:hypothetical protein
MNEVKIGSENVKKAFDAGSSEVKKVLKDLFPDVLVPKEVWREMKKEELSLELDNVAHLTAGFDIHVKDIKSGNCIAWIWNGAVNINEPKKYKVEKGKTGYPERGNTCYGFVFYKKEI